MGISIAGQLAASFTAGDPGLIAPALLNRAQLADGLVLAIGRDAIIAEWTMLMAAFTDRSAMVAAEASGEGMVAIALHLRGRLRIWPAPLATGTEAPAADSPPVALVRHLWLRTEAGRLGHVEAVTDWWGLAAAAGRDIAALAHALGAAAPCHRPLGELASGLAQLEAWGDDPAARFNARRLAGDEALLGLAAALPDARLTADHRLAGADLWRLQGHSRGRRVSLAASRIGDGPILWDRLALAATAHRPFWPA